MSKNYIIYENLFADDPRGAPDTLPPVPKRDRVGDWVTTEEVARAVGVSVPTIHRWGRHGVLPAHKVHNGGARGRVAMWPAETPKQAVWVLAQLEALRSWDDIRAALAAGEFKPTRSDA